MSSRSFRSVFMVASCAGAALGCYLVSLKVASERARLENVEARIVTAQRDMRMLQTEIGTRGRLSQLERWNAGAFALSAPAADQLLKNSFELARLAEPERKVDFQAPVVLASAPMPEKTPVVGQPEVDDSGLSTTVASNVLLHEASLKSGTREVPARTVAELPSATSRSTGKPVIAAKPASPRSVEKPGLAAAQSHSKNETRKPVSVALKKPVDKRPADHPKAVTRPVRLAKVDPLAPLPPRHSVTSKDSASDR